MGASEQDLAGSFILFRRDIEAAEAVRQRAIVAALADHRRALEDIEAAYRRDVAAAQCCYSQRNGQRAARLRVERYQRQVIAGSSTRWRRFPRWQRTGSPAA